MASSSPWWISMSLFSQQDSTTCATNWTYFSFCFWLFPRWSLGLCRFSWRNTSIYATCLHKSTAIFEEWLRRWKRPTHLMQLWQIHLQECWTLRGTTKGWTYPEVQQFHKCELPHRLTIFRTVCVYIVHNSGIFYFVRLSWTHPFFDCAHKEHYKFWPT